MSPNSPQSTTVTPINHSIQLDGLRFFAVSVIMLGHWYQWTWTNPVYAKLPLVHGVDLFYVLSGFLITRILLNNRNSAPQISPSALLKTFYVRRFLRIFPIYYLLIFGLFAFNYANTRELFPWLVTYTSNLYQSINNVSVGEFNHFWSLAVEEQFYLFWPLLMLLLPKRNIPWVLGITLVLALLSRAYFHFFVHKWLATSFFTLNCMHLFSLGGILAYFQLNKPDWFNSLSQSYWFFLAFVIYSLLFYGIETYHWDWFKVIFDEFLFGIVAFFAIAVAARNGFKYVSAFILEHPWVLHVGKISYGMYIIHLFIPSFYYWLFPKLGISLSNKFTEFVFLYLLTFGLAHLSWTYLESPINRLKSRFSYAVH